MFNRNLIIVMASGLIISGCGKFNVDPEGSFFGGGRVTAASVNQLFPGDRFEKIDLIDLIDPNGLRKNLPDHSDLKDQSLARSKRDTADQDRRELARAYAAFENYPNKTTRRNRIQDRIMSASEQRCNLYKTYIKRVDTYQNSILGSLTTILGGAGAIVTSTTAARVLAGSAGIGSGIRAELNQAFFSSIATSVIVPAIDLRRVKIRSQIDNSRNKKSTRSYTLEASILDALRYHGACSIDSGLDEAGISVKNAINPGLDTFAYTMAQLNQAQEIIDNNKASPDTLKTIRRLRIQMLNQGSSAIPLDDFSDVFDGDEESLPTNTYTAFQARIKPTFEVLLNIAKSRASELKETEASEKTIKDEIDKLLDDDSGTHSLKKHMESAIQMFNERFKDDAITETKKIVNLAVARDVDEPNAKAATTLKLGNAILDGRKLTATMRAFIEQLDIRLGEIKKVITDKSIGSDKFAAALSSAIEALRTYVTKQPTVASGGDTEVGKKTEKVEEIEISPPSPYELKVKKLSLRTSPEVASDNIIGILANGLTMDAKARLEANSSDCDTWLNVTFTSGGKTVEGWACEKKADKVYLMKAKQGTKPSIPVEQPEPVPAPEMNAPNTTPPPPTPTTNQ
jgi:hypothetical protein